MKTVQRVSGVVLSVALGVSLFSSQASAASDGALDILRQGLLGAGTGAISAGMSGGKAGRGALIGAGTNVIGGALLGFLTEPSYSSYSRPVTYAEPVYTPAPQVQYVQPVYQPEPIVYSQPAPVYTPPPTDTNKQIIKQGLLGAGVGAISASASGGKAGMGALIGAGTNVIGGALLDTLTAPSTPRSVYYSSTPPNEVPAGAVKHILRKFDSSGHVISEEEFWQ